MNKDEAEKYINLGISALNSGDKAKAIRLFQKSIQLYPTDEARKYLKLAHETEENFEKSDPNSKKSAQQPAPKSSTLQYTPEQETACRKPVTPNNK